jgi:hypothetical protein
VIGQPTVVIDGQTVIDRGELLHSAGGAATTQEG